MPYELCINLDDSSSHFDSPFTPLKQPKLLEGIPNPIGKAPELLKNGSYRKIFLIPIELSTQSYTYQFKFKYSYILLSNRLDILCIFRDMSYIIYIISKKLN